MNEKDLKKYIQSGFKMFKEVNKHLRYYFDAYYIYKEGIILGTTDNQSIDRYVVVNPEEVEQYRYSGVTSLKLYDEIKDAKQTRITVLNADDKIKILDISDIEKMIEATTIDKLWNPNLCSEDEFVAKEILPKFYKKMHLLLPEIQKNSTGFEPVDESIIEALLQKRPIIMTHKGVTFRFSRSLFPELNKGTRIDILLLDYKEPGKRYLVFRDTPNEYVIVYTLIAVLDLEETK